ncbi:predicted protein [Nematostella vectensis]|uniref:Aminotransferase class I/classII large domain-containing protein n=1 Tax=Nematostella vectensis TaxID=45351 RepID=A7S4A4_NEMVE|nr:predicted protein [Nematostella vectensis]|eukprot:XP_001633546.1 predicted protein [Nematostella vectensis]
MDTLSTRGHEIKDFKNVLACAFNQQMKRAYDAKRNPTGIINLGTSENKLMFDVIEEKLQSLPAVPESLTHYGSFHGVPGLKKAIAKMLEHFMKPIEPIKDCNIIVFNGCGPVVEALGMLLAERGDAFMTTAPYYGAFKDDLCRRGGVDIVPVYLSNEIANDESKPYELSMSKMESAYQQACKEVAFMNPRTFPLPPSKMYHIRHSLHVIVDEIYLLSVYKEGHKMPNVLSLQGIPDPERTHVVWGFSKDMCVSGFRAGAIYTVNKDLCGALKSMAYLQSTSLLTQHYLEHMISDLDWLDHVFLPTNQRRLQECSNIVCDALRSVDVPYVDGIAGLFIWADFRKLLLSPTFEEEWEIFNEFMNYKLYITPGQAFYYNEPGWFRIIFATRPSILQLGMERLKSCVNHLRQRADLQKLSIA